MYITQFQDVSILHNYKKTCQPLYVHVFNRQYYKDNPDEAAMPDLYAEKAKERNALEAAAKEAKEDKKAKKKAEKRKEAPKEEGNVTSSIYPIQQSLGSNPLTRSHDIVFVCVPKLFWIGIKYA